MVGIANSTILRLSLWMKRCLPTKFWSNNKSCLVSLMKTVTHFVVSYFAVLDIVGHGPLYGSYITFDEKNREISTFPKKETKSVFYVNFCNKLRIVKYELKFLIQSTTSNWNTPNLNTFSNWNAYLGSVYLSLTETVKNVLFELIYIMNSIYF